MFQRMSSESFQGVGDAAPYSWILCMPQTIKVYYSAGYLGGVKIPPYSTDSNDHLTGGYGIRPYDRFIEEFGPRGGNMEKVPKRTLNSKMPSKRKRGRKVAPLESSI